MSFIVARVPLNYGDMIGRLVSSEDPAAPSETVADAKYAPSPTPCPFCSAPLTRLTSPPVTGRVVKLYEDTLQVLAGGVRCCQALIDPFPPGTAVLSCTECRIHLSTREDAP